MQLLGQDPLALADVKCYANLLSIYWAQTDQGLADVVRFWFELLLS